MSKSCRSSRTEPTWFGTTGPDGTWHLHNSVEHITEPEKVLGFLGMWGGRSEVEIFHPNIFERIGTSDSLGLLAGSSPRRLFSLRCEKDV